MNFDTLVTVSIVLGIVAAALVAYAYRREVFGTKDFNEAAFSRPDKMKVADELIVHAKVVLSERKPIDNRATEHQSTLTAGAPDLPIRNMLEKALNGAPPGDRELCLALYDHVHTLRAVEKEFLLLLAEREAAQKLTMPATERKAIEMALLREKRSIEGFEPLVTH